MLRIVKYAFALIMCSGAWAQPVPDAPQPHVTTRDVIFVAAGFGSSAADAWTTQTNLVRGCTEANPLLGATPSPARLWGTVMAMTAGQEFVAWEFKKHGHARIAGVIAGGIVAGHTAAAIHNARQACGSGR